MRLIDPTKTQMFREPTEHGFIDRTEHFNGSVDANVHVAPLRLHLTAGAPPDQRTVDAIHELEEAAREYRLAQNAGNQGWLEYATLRHERAKQKVRECQHG